MRITTSMCAILHAGPSSAIVLGMGKIKGAVGLAVATGRLDLLRAAARNLEGRVLTPEGEAVLAALAKALRR